MQLVAGAALVPPFWLPASMRTFLLPHDGISLAGAVTAIVIWLFLAAGRRRVGDACRRSRGAGDRDRRRRRSRRRTLRRGEDPGLVVRAGAAELLLGVVGRRVRHAGRCCRRVLPAGRRRGHAHRVAGPTTGAARRRACSSVVGLSCVAALSRGIGRRRRGRGAACRSPAAGPTRRRHRCRRRRRRRRGRSVACVLRQ